MKLLFWRPAKEEGMHHAANVIADAVQAAKDAEIAEASAELVEARFGRKQSRAAIGLAVRASREVRRALDAAGEHAEATAGRIARDLNGHD